MNKYKINRKGYVVNTGMCGMNGDTKLEYKIEVTVINPQLNEHGFLVDHNDIHTVVSSVISTAKSCELSCILARDVLKQHMRNQRRFQITAMSIQVGMVGGDAYFTALY